MGSSGTSDGRAFLFAREAMEWGSVSLRIHIPVSRRKLARRTVKGAKQSGKRRERETEKGKLAGGTQRPRVMPREDNDAQGIPLGTVAVSNVRAKRRRASKNVMRNAVAGSGTAARTIGWNEPVHQKIIGRTMAVGRSGLGRPGFFRRSVHGEVPLLVALVCGKVWKSRKTRRAAAAGARGITRTRTGRCGRRISRRMRSLARAAVGRSKGTVRADEDRRCWWLGQVRSGQLGGLHGE